MGKRIISQRRGRGTSTYRAHTFRALGKTSYGVFKRGEAVTGRVIDIVHSHIHSAPLIKVEFKELGKEVLMPGAEGVTIGQKIVIDYRDEVAQDEIKEGNVYALKNIPEGTSIYNIELTPGDSGKIVRSGGTYARVLSHMKKYTKIILPSKKVKLVNNKCRAIVGRIGGSGREEKPILKAGDKAKMMKKTNKLYPRVSGVSMSAFDHPHGSSRSQRKGRPTVAPKNAPPGRKVGMIRPRHTGRNK